MVLPKRSRCIGLGVVAGYTLALVLGMKLEGHGFSGEESSMSVFAHWWRELWLVVVCQVGRYLTRFALDLLVFEEQDLQRHLAAISGGRVLPTSFLLVSLSVTVNSMTASLTKSLLKDL